MFVHAAELKALMARAGLGPSGTEKSESGFAPSTFTAAADSASATSFQASDASFRWDPTPSEPWLSAPPASAAGARAEPALPSPPPSGSSQGASPTSTTTSPVYTAAPTSLFDLFYPGWPRDLPSPDLTSRLVEIYFTRPHAVQGVINASRFRSAMLLSPTSVGFPHPALIHAVCAIAAMIISPDYFNSEVPYWQHAAPSAAEYHFNASKAALERAITFGDKLFQIAQVNVLITYYAYNKSVPSFALPSCRSR